MSACLDFEQTPLHVMTYCAVPESQLTHQSPLVGDIHVQALLLTAQHVLPSQGILQLVLQFGWFRGSQAGLPSWSCYG